MIPDWVDGFEVETPFDVIVSGFAIHHQPNDRKKELYAEIYELRRFLSNVSPGKTTREIEEAYYQDKKDNILAPVETQCQWLRDIGFLDVDCFFKVFELALFGGRNEIF